MSDKLHSKNVDVTIDTGNPREDYNLLSIASHELRTTLSIIKWYTEMLLDGDCGPLTEDQVKYLKTIESSNQRAIGLIRSLLNVSRLDLGTFCVVPTEVVFSQVTKEVINENKVHLEEKQLNVKEDYEISSEGKPLSLIADKQICLVLIRALLSNAINFSKAGGTIEIKFSNRKRGEIYGGEKLDHDGIVFSISDSGIGIPEVDKKKVFTKLFKASNVSDSENSGSGLGLYVISKVAEKTGGKVWFESVQNIGTTFFVIFPQLGMQKKDGKTIID